MRLISILYSDVFRNANILIDVLFNMQNLIMSIMGKELRSIVDFVHVVRHIARSRTKLVLVSLKCVMVITLDASVIPHKKVVCAGREYNNVEELKMTSSIKVEGVFNVQNLVIILTAQNIDLELEGYTVISEISRRGQLESEFEVRHNIPTAWYVLGNHYGSVGFYFKNILKYFPTKKINEFLNS